MKDNQPRIKYVDYFRGIGIILMIMGHIGFSDVFNHYIHGFHMPLFFFASGLFYKENKGLNKKMRIRNWYNNTKRNAKKLIGPYLLWGLFYIVLDVCFFRGNLVEDIECVLVNVTSDSFPIGGALWFLVAFFFCNSFYSFLDCIFVNKCIVYTMVVIIVIVKLYFFEMPNCPLGIGPAIIGMFFLLLGIMYQKILKEVDTYLCNPILNIVIYIGASIIILVNKGINMRRDYYGNVFLVITSSVILISLINLVKSIYSKLERNRFCCAVSNVVCSIGEHSMSYLCTNQLMILLVLNLFEKLEVNRYIAKILCLVITICVIYYLSDIFWKFKKGYER